MEIIRSLVELTSQFECLPDLMSVIKTRIHNGTECLSGFLAVFRPTFLALFLSIFPRLQRVDN